MYVFSAMKRVIKVFLAANLPCLLLSNKEYLATPQKAKVAAATQGMCSFQAKTIFLSVMTQDSIAAQKKDLSSFCNIKAEGLYMLQIGAAIPCQAVIMR